MRLPQVFPSKYFRRIIVFLILFVFGGLLFPPVTHLDIVVKGEFPRSSYAELYHSSSAPSFDAKTLTRPYRVEREDGVRLLSRISSIRAVKFIRFDPVVGELPFQIESLDIQGDSGHVRYSGQDIAEKALKLQQVERKGALPDIFNAYSVGPDPQLIFSVPKDVASTPLPKLMAHWLLLALACGLLIFGFERIWSWRQNPPAVWAAIHRLFARVGRCWSDEATITFSAAAVWVYFSLISLFVGWVGLHLHQSSIGVWDNMYATAIPQSSIRVGEPRAIRSDEWNTFTPWMLSQVQLGMPIDNPNLGASASSVLTGAPVAGPLMLAQPKYWGFAWFDLETGFSWFWGFKVFGALAAVFSLLLMLTKGDVVVSLGGSIAVYGSSLVQWWFSGISPELLMGFSMSVVGSVYLLQARKRGGVVVGAVILALVIPNLLMHIYPPHLLPLAYLAVFTVGACLWNAGAWANFRQGVRWRLSWMSLAVVALLGLVGLWWSLSRETIELMLHTVYPGKRFVLGGDMKLAYVFHGIFESWRIADWPLPFIPTNQTAASQMWVLFPLAFALVKVRDWVSAGFRLPALLVVYCLMVVTWTSVPIPTGAREWMAHAGWSLSPPWNALVGLGVASMMLVSILVAGVASDRMVLIRWPRQVLPFLAVGVVAVYGLYLRSIDAEFFDLGRIALAATFLGVFVWAIHGGHRWWFFGLCVLSALPGLQVNPVRNDLSAYLGKDLFVQAKALGGQSGDTWAVFGDTDIAQGLKSVGLTVVNGSHYAPRLPFLNILDPLHAYQNVWNRYAHVGFASGRPGVAPVFKLMFPDQYEVSLDVCGNELKALGVKHVAYTYEPSEWERRCLTPVPLAVSDGRVGLYTLKPSAGAGM